MDSKELTDKEGAKEINKLAIINGIKQLVTDPYIKEGEPVYTHILGSNGEMKLEYVRQKLGDKNIFIYINLINPKTNDRIAYREYHYFIGGGKENPNEIKIDGYVEVDEQEQSRGYGAGLMLGTNIVLEDAVRRYPEFRGKMVTGHIVDSSINIDKEEFDQIAENREGWTSYFVKQLGYKNVGEGTWEKVYQYAGKNK